MKVKSLSRVRLLATPWTAAHQAPPSMGFSRQEYRSGVPLPSPVLVSSVQQSDSVIHTCTYLFHYGLLQDIEYSSLCYTVGPCLALIEALTTGREAEPAMPICFVPPAPLSHSKGRI